MIRTSLATVLAAAAVGAAAAQPPNAREDVFGDPIAAVGDDFEVVGPNSLGFDPKSPRVAPLPGGGFVMSWFDGEAVPEDEDVGGVFARFYDEEAVPAGPAFLVAEVRNDIAISTHPVATGADAFLILWDGYSTTELAWQGNTIGGRRFDMDGDPIGEAFRVPTGLHDGQRRPSAAMLSGGGFVVAYEDDGDATPYRSMRARRYDAAGAPLDAEDFQVNTEVQRGASGASVAALDGGGFVVAYTFGSELVPPTGDGWGAAILARVFDASGQPVTEEFVANTITEDDQLHASVAAVNGGGFVIVWTDESFTLGHTFGNEVRGQLFAANGDPVGDEFLVNTTTENSQERPVVARIDTGGFMVAWESFAREPGELIITRGISGRRFDAAAQPVDAEDFFINTSYGGQQTAPSIGDLARGGIIVTWDHATGGRARRFLTNPDDVLSPLETHVLDLLGNDDGAGLQVSQINGQPLSEGGSVTLPSGAAVRMSGGEIRYDPSGWAAALTLADENTLDDAFTYTAANGAGTDTADAVVRLTGPVTPPEFLAITRWSPASSPTDADELVFRVFFSEAVFVNEAAFDVAGSTATVRDATQFADAASYLITVGQGDLATMDGEVGLGVSLRGDITDFAGYGLASDLPSGSNESFIIDNSAPLPALSTPGATPVSAGFPVVIDFGEDVSGFTLADLDVAGGGASGLSGGNGRYQVTITPGATADTVTVSIPAAVAFDQINHPNLASAPLNIPVDRVSDRRLLVSRSGLGDGAVGNGGAIDCGADCAADFRVGVATILTATPEPGSLFDGWTPGLCPDDADPVCRVVFDTDKTVSARFSLDDPGAGGVFAAILPGARSGYFRGPDITLFATVLAAARNPVQDCSIAAPAGAPFSLSYRRVDAGNQAYGDADPVFDLAAGGAQGFLFILTPLAPTAPDGYVFIPEITCENAALRPVEGVNSALISIGPARGPDILSIGATASADGVIRITTPGAAGLMTAAAVNVGFGDGTVAPENASVTVTADTGEAVLPVAITLCELDEFSVCRGPRADSVVTEFLPDAPKYFGVFVRDHSAGGIPFDPAGTRIYLRFTDGTGALRSTTSAAITAPAE